MVRLLSSLTDDLGCLSASDNRAPLILLNIFLQFISMALLVVALLGTSTNENILHVSYWVKLDVSLSQGAVANTPAIAAGVTPAIAAGIAERMRPMGANWAGHWFLNTAGSCFRPTSLADDANERCQALVETAEEFDAFNRADIGNVTITIPADTANFTGGGGHGSADINWTISVGSWNPYYSREADNIFLDCVKAGENCFHLVIIAFTLAVARFAWQFHGRARCNPKKDTQKCRNVLTLAVPFIMSISTLLQYEATCVRPLAGYVVSNGDSRMIWATRK